MDERCRIHRTPKGQRLAERCPNTATTTVVRLKGTKHETRVPVCADCALREGE